MPGSQYWSRWSLRLSSPRAVIISLPLQGQCSCHGKRQTCNRSLVGNPAVYSVQALEGERRCTVLAQEPAPANCQSTSEQPEEPRLANVGGTFRCLASCYSELQTPFTWTHKLWKGTVIRSQTVSDGPVVHYVWAKTGAQCVYRQPSTRTTVFTLKHQEKGFCKLSVVLSSISGVLSLNWPLPIPESLI